MDGRRRRRRRNDNNNITDDGDNNNNGHNTNAGKAKLFLGGEFIIFAWGMPDDYDDEKEDGGEEERISQL